MLNQNKLHQKSNRQKGMEGKPGTSVLRGYAARYRHVLSGIIPKTRTRGKVERKKAAKDIRHTNRVTTQDMQKFASQRARKTTPDRFTIRRVSY